ncbi:deoxyuridine 5'-triphosphate nucleotidohydrolase-like [Ornithodoros turicata]|uniref:deoxyuridine 5'-triphosphate nucleotidohydrolase-like n=1 Tax=Ornithodoros turicata TaxID=34597 RepID=UPI003138C73A
MLPRWRRLSTFPLACALSRDERIARLFRLYYLRQVETRRCSTMPGEICGPVLRFAKLSPNAYVPTRGSKKAAGYDLYSAYDYVVAPHEKALCMTDIQIEVPEGCYGRVAPRSGLAVKHFIDVGAGVIDEDYRGNVGVVLFNFGSQEFKVNKGDRIAQLICERITYPDLEEVESLDSTARGEGGFGSTGTN